MHPKPGYLVLPTSMFVCVLLPTEPIESPEIKIEKLVFGILPKGRHVGPPWHLTRERNPVYPHSGLSKGTYKTNKHNRFKELGVGFQKY